MKKAESDESKSTSHTNLINLAAYITSVLLPGCGEDSDELPETATVKVTGFSPNPLNAIEPVTTSENGQVCKVGDILQPGESCFYPGTDIEFSVFDDSAQFLYFNVGDSIHIKNSIINQAWSFLRSTISPPSVFQLVRLSIEIVRKPTWAFPV